jgi:hypothetical protein
MALSSRPAKVIANAFGAGFHRMAQCARPPPVGSSDRVTRYRHFQRRGLVGEVASGLDGAAVAGVDRLNRIRAADYPAYRHVVLEERHSADVVEHDVVVCSYVSDEQELRA